MSESQSQPPFPDRRNWLADVVMALRFFSRLPTGKSPHVVPDLNRIAVALPFASLVIGVGPALVLWAMVAGGFPPLFGSLAAAATFAIVTGAMSEDAIADAADGLFGGHTPERRLEILKDSRHGTYGVLAIVFFVALKVAALAAMAAIAPLAAATLWLVATTLARSGALYLPHALPPARATGAAAAAGRVSRNAFATGIVCAVVIALVLALPFAASPALVLIPILGLGVAVGWTRLCHRFVGGQTGDLIGALQGLLEITILSVFLRILI